MHFEKKDEAWFKEHIYIYQRRAQISAENRKPSLFATLNVNRAKLRIMSKAICKLP